MIKVFDVVLGREETIQDEVTPENEREVILVDIAPQIEVDEEDCE